VFPWDGGNAFIELRDRLLHGGLPMGGFAGISLAGKPFTGPETTFDRLRPATIGRRCGFVDHGGATQA